MTTTMQTTTKTLVEQFLNVRRVSTPLVIVRTNDAMAVSKSILDAAIEKLPTTPPVVQWDAAQGFVGRNPLGKKALCDLFPADPENDEPGANPLEILNPADAMHKIRGIAKNAIVFVFNAHRIWQDLTTVQAIWNLRDHFKNSERTLVMLTTPEAVAPRELESDVIVIDDPLPTEEQIEAIVTKQTKQAGVPTPKGDAMRKVIDSMKGLSAFVVEQIVALSLRKSGVDLGECWQRKIQSVETTPGATVYKGDMTFDSIGGHAGIKRDLMREINSKKPVRLVVVLDEFEKMIAGASSDHVGDGGVAKDKAQVILTQMQDHGYRGLVAFGHPGTGKTALAKAMAAAADCLCIIADMGAMSKSHVGESEQAIRAFFTLVLAIAGEGGAFMFATCNSTGAITPELRRRFKTGFYFIDLPTREEKDAIWKVHLTRFGLEANPLKNPRPDDSNWTGSDIEVCCEKADNYGITLLEAAESIVPGAVAQPELIERRRREAHNRMLSSATGRTYSAPEAREALAEPTPSVDRQVRL